MKCVHCGAVIPKGELRCPECGREIRIVPDYNPLDDVLAAQVKGSFDGSGSPLDDYEYDAGRGRRGNSQTVISGRAAGRTAVTRRTASNTASRRTSMGSGSSQMTLEEKRRRAARRRVLRRKKRLRALILLGMAATVSLIAGIVLYQFSYSGLVNKGNKAFEEKQYTDAEAYFQRAVKKKPKKAEAYEGLTRVYLAQEDEDKAESMLLDAVDEYPDSAAVYEACFSFYLTIQKEGEIPLLLDEAEQSVAEALSDYACKSPEFSLSNDETFDDVQQLSLESDEDTIYYTTDESNPFYSDTRIKYEEPIQISEGDTVVKAVSVNKKNIPSLTVTKTYTVELPVEDAPAVSPSTGQYDTPVQISIVVPDGYTAYYTMDATEPDENSQAYTGPVDMPEGSTIFKAVLVNGRGRLSGVTTRNYELTIASE